MSSSSAAVLGTGLLGSSVGLGLRHAGWDVAGWDPNEATLDQALDRAAISTRMPSADVGGFDLVVLAAPPDAVMQILGDLDTDALVTDIAGVKVPVVKAGAHLPHFVGGHPMAGGETTGPAMASSSLFHGATWVLATDGATSEDLGAVEDVVRSLGANPILMTAAEHDAAVARISHLPHVVAAALMQLVDDDPAARALAGGGFRDLTRIAAGDSGWWSEVLASNQAEVGSAVDDLADALSRWKARSGRDLARLLESARQARLGLAEHNSQVRVVLMDRPGEIARVGHALENSRVDVRDMQLRHGEFGGGGILTISVREEARDALLVALADEGFQVR